MMNPPHLRRSKSYRYRLTKEQLEEQRDQLRLALSFAESKPRREKLQQLLDDVGDKLVNLYA
jgi:hypothetical protein